MVVRLARTPVALALVPGLPAQEQHLLAARGEPSLAAAALLHAVLARHPGAFTSRSHTADLVAVAVAPVRVGVDVERLLQDSDADALFLRRTCTPGEAEQVQAATSPGRLLTELWTRKEAVAKADGRGLALPFAELDAAASGWTVADVPAGLAHAAACAWEGEGVLDVSWFSTA